MSEEITKVTEWSRVENDGSGDYYIVPVDLFNDRQLEDAIDDPDYDEKMGKHALYVGGFADGFEFRGEIK